MNWQSTLYLSSLLLTFTLSGILAYYGWRQRHQGGSRSYARLAFSECLMAFFEILSVLSPSIDLALFFFKLRYTIGAFIAIFWLLFALDYSGHKNWISRRFQVWLFAIPLVTQLLLWSNSLHYLWVRQEVSFFQKGPLWIADIATRVPGPGYLIHIIYILLLTLTGIALILWIAWKMRREFIGQALMLAGAGFTAFFFTINSMFNLLPRTEYNIFTPGLGLSVVMIALAVFWFDFLKRAPVVEAGPRQTRLRGPERRFLTLLTLFYLFLVTGFSTSAYFSYTNYRRQYREQVTNQLTAIAHLKINGLQTWRAERIGDAEVLHQSSAFSLLMQTYLKNPGNTQTQQSIQIWLDSLRDSYKYDRVFFLDINGKELFASPPANGQLAAHLEEDSAAALAVGKVIFVDFHRDEESNRNYLALLIPIYAQADHSQPLGVVVFRIDPAIFLYPYLNEWPATSDTAETLLVRLEGNEVLFLNPVRFASDSALNLRFPLANTDILAVRAVLGETGVIEGTDYRGKAVLGSVSPVPDSPWFIIARMDRSEIDAPLQQRLWQTILFYGAMLVASAAGFLLFWRRQRVSYFEDQLKTLGALQASEEKFRLAFDTSPDSIAITRMSDGVFISVNRGFEEITGYTHDQVLGRTSTEINVWKDPEDRKKLVETLRAKGVVHNYPASFLTAEGEIFGLMSAAIIHLNGEPHILNVTRDITDRKRAEESLLESEERFRTLVEKAPSTIFIQTNGRFAYINQEGLKLFGAESANQLLGQSVLEFFHPSYRESVKARIHQLNENRQAVPRANEVILKLDGSLVAVEVSAVPFSFGGALGALVFVQDITERIQAEQATKESEEKYRLLAETTPDIILLHDMEGRIRYVNQAGLDFCAISKDGMLGQPLHLIFPSLNLEELAARKNQRTAGDNSLYHYEVNYVHKDGRQALLEASSSPIRRQGQIIQILVVARDITQRKLIEQALRESEERFRKAVIDAPFPIMIHAEDGTVELVNNEWVKVTGYSSSELRTLADWADKAYGSRKQLMIEDIEKLYRLTDKEDEGENIITTKAGLNRTWYFSSTPLGKAADGRRIVMSMALDITELKKTEENLRQTSEYLENLFNYANAPIIVWDPEFTILRFNHAFEYLTGRFASDVIGKKLDILFPQESRAASLALIAQTLGGERWEAVEIPVQTHEGEIRTILWNSANLYGLDGKTVVSTIAQGQDITERRQAEETVIRQVHELQVIYNAVHRLNSSIIPEELANGIIDTLEKTLSYENCAVLLVDEQAGKLIPFAISGQEGDSGFNVTDRSSIDAQTIEIGKGITGWVAETGQAVRLGNASADSRYYPVRPKIQSELCVPLWTERGVIGVLNIETTRPDAYTEADQRVLETVATQIALAVQRAQIQVQLQSYAVELEQRVEARTRELRSTQEKLVRQERLAMLGELAGSVSHELRNPLGVIANAVYYLGVAQPNASEKIKEYLDIIDKETHIADKIITDLLNYSRIKSANREPFSLFQVTQKVLERYRIAESITVELHIPEDLPRVDADPSQIMQVLGNLIINAAQAMVSVSSTNQRLIVISAKELTSNDHSYVVIDVQDTGEGILPENLEKIFEPLFTTKAKGIGLGLPICKNLVEANSGWIEVKSEMGKGSVFSIRLPAYMEAK